MLLTLWVNKEGCLGAHAWADSQGTGKGGEEGGRKRSPLAPYTHLHPSLASGPLMVAESGSPCEAGQKEPPFISAL